MRTNSPGASVLLADEHVERQIVDALRGFGWSVVWIVDLKAEARKRAKRGASARARRWLDPRIWDIADRRQATILTFDHGLEQDAHDRGHHHGLIRLEYATTIKGRHRALLTVNHLDELWGADLADRVFIVTVSGIRPATARPGRARRH